MCIRKSSPSHDSISSQASALHGSVDSLSVAFDSSIGLQPPWRTSPTVKRSCPDPRSQKLYKASNKFLPRRMRTGGKPRPGKRVAATILSEFYQCDPGMWATVGATAILRHRGCHSRRLLVFINSRRGRRAFEVNFRTLQSNSRRIGISDRWHSCAYI